MDRKPVLLASLVVKGDGSPSSLRFGYNPESLSISRTVLWTEREPKPHRKVPKTTYGGAGPRQLSMELMLDGWPPATRKVADDVGTLLSWCEPTARSVAAKRPQAPVLQLRWGTTSYFDAVLTSVEVRYTLFDPQGVPLRATASISLREVPRDAARQNPTSGGEPGNRTRTMLEGETLQSVAYDEYGSAAAWRPVAQANGIDDPLRVAAGTTLLLPPIESLTTPHPLAEGAR